MNDSGPIKNNPPKSLDFLSLESIRAFAKDLSEGLMIVDAHGIICHINSAARHLYSGGAVPHEGMPLSDVVPHDWVEVKKVLTTGVPQLCSLMRLPQATVVVNRMPLIHQRSVVGVICMLQDLDNFRSIVSEFSEFQTLKKEFEAVLERFEGCFLTVDAHGIICNVNSPYEKLISLGRQGIIGRYLGEIQRSPEKLVELYHQSLASGVQTTLPIPLGSGTSALGTATPASDAQGKLFRVLLQIKDRVSHSQTSSRSLDTDEALPSKELQKICRASGFTIHSGVMNRVVLQALKISKTSSCVLITGESGVGKTMMASLIHNNSDRAKKPFVTINCSAIPEHLLESELFGYEKGAFTGASSAGKAGLFETANNGTLFLDEIGELQYSLQSKLLEAIEKKSFIRVGSTKRISVDIRIITATNKNLADEVEKGAFRRDLFYRLNVIPLHIPSLRERPDDVMAMISQTVSVYNEQNGTTKSLSPELLSWLLRYPFPGNMRELINIMEWLLVMSESNLLQLHDLPARLRQEYLLDPQDQPHQEERRPPAETAGGVLPQPAPGPGENTNHASSEELYTEQILDSGCSLKEAMERFECRYLEQAMKKYGSIQEVSDKLNIHFSTLWRKLIKYGIIEKNA